MARNNPRCTLPWYSLYAIGGSLGIKNCCWQNNRIDPEFFNSLEDVWNSSQAVAIRKKMLEGKYENTCPKSCPHLVRGDRNILWIQKFHDYILKNTLNPFILKNASIIKKSIENGEVRLKSKPLTLVLYRYFDCNLNCAICFERDYKQSIGKGLDNLGDFEKLIKNCKHVSFRGGEPLITGRKYMLDILKNHPNKTLDLTTNGVFINKMDFNKFLHRFKSITVSLNGATKKTHEQINRLSSLEKVMSNIEYLIKLKNSKSIDTLDIIINMVIIDSNFREMQDFIELGHKLGCKVNFDLYRGEGYSKGDISYLLPMSKNQAELFDTFKNIRSIYGDQFGLDVIWRVINNKSIHLED